MSEGSTLNRARGLWRRPWLRVLGSVSAALLIGIAVGETLGWPFMSGPIQSWLESALGRTVKLSSDPAVQPRVRIRLLGSLRISAAHIEIGAPGWSKAPHMLLARDAYMRLGYADLWRASRGGPLLIRELRAAQLDGNVERLADGRASWQFGAAGKADAPPTARTPLFEQLRVGEGAVSFRDDVLGADVQARFSLSDGRAAAAAGQGASVAAAASAPVAPASAPAQFRFDATGRFRDRPVKVEFASNGVLSVVGANASKIAWPVTLTASVGRAGMTFVGTATDPLRLTALRGRFEMHGPSLAAVGDPLGVTLPTTGAFRATGLIAKDGDIWNTLFDKVVVGSSNLTGAFTFDNGRKVPMLAGRLRGTRLLLADLGPAVGTAPPGAASAPASAASTPASKVAAAGAAPAASAPLTKGRGRVLPDRPFDLPSLRAMDANVLVDIDNLDLGSSLVEPLRPLRTHLVLADAVLTLRDIDARTGQGTLNGFVQLDGRTAQALWSANLGLRDVRLERWLRQSRNDGAPVYISGRLNGQAKVAGQGKSTAAILGSLRGAVRLQLLDGTVSHLAVEAAGLDVAQALGVLVKGDDALPIECAVADLAAEQGLLRPRVLVLDTSDSTVWAEGSLSLANEALDLRLLVSPKDFSPLALRAPVRVTGTFIDPSVSIEAKPLAGRVGVAALLALVNPLAAVLPFFDTGDRDDAQRGASACQALASRIGAPHAVVQPSLRKQLAARPERAVGKELRQ